MILHIFLLSPPGGFEWILIFLAFVLLFGGRKIPELMKNVGKGIREFNDAKDTGKEKEENDSGKEKKDK